MFYHESVAEQITVFPLVKEQMYFFSIWQKSIQMVQENNKAMLAVIR